MPHSPYRCIGSFLFVLATSPASWAVSRPRCKGPFRLVSLLKKLISADVGPFGDGFDTEMAPRMGRKKAAGPARTTGIITRSAEVEAKLKRIGDLKVRFAGVGKALRPALLEMAERTSQQLRHPTYHKDGPRKAQYDALVAELEKIRELNSARRVAYHESLGELKAVSVQHETLHRMTMIEKQYRKKVEEIRDSRLAHLRLCYETETVQGVN